MPDEPSTPPTLPPPAAFVATSEAELRIAAAARATTMMHPLPPLKARPRVIMDAETLGWTELSAGARALIERLDGKTVVIELAEGTDAAADAVFDALTELQRAGVIVFDE